MIESYLRQRRKDKDILLMTHIVIGYPSLEASYEIVREMVAAGVDLMELQIPFSEPMADGPVILRANQDALAGGVRVRDCLEFARRAATEFPIPFLFMTYYNILFKFGVEAFADRMAAMGVQGAIIPDLPPEEATGLPGRHEPQRPGPHLHLRPQQQRRADEDDFRTWRRLHLLRRPQGGHRPADRLLNGSGRQLGPLPRRHQPAAGGRFRGKGQG